MCKKVRSLSYAKKTKRTIYYPLDSVCARGHDCSEAGKYVKTGRCVVCCKTMKKYKDQVRDMLRGKIKSKHVLGYTRKQLVQRLEYQFDEHMSWENYGTYWHIDHRISVKSFVDKSVTCSKTINALANLKPLEARENQRKSFRNENESY